LASASIFSVSAFAFAPKAAMKFEPAAPLPNFGTWIAGASLDVVLAVGVFDWDGLDAVD